LNRPGFREGSNEINRLLIPGTILKRAMKGETPLQKEAMKAFESLMSPSFDELDDCVPFAAEKALIAGLKQAFLVVAESAVQKYMDRIKDEREESAANRLPPFIGLIFKEFHSPGTNIHNTH